MIITYNEEMIMTYKGSFAHDPNIGIEKQKDEGKEKKRVTPNCSLAYY